MTALTTDEYRTLLTRALEDAADANTTVPDAHRLFTPSSHRLALAPDVTIVQGARGTGKTYWAKSMAEPRLREIAADAYMMPRLKSVDVITGFSRQPDEGAPYPGKRPLTRLMNTHDIDPVDFWSAVILNSLDVPEVKGASGWAERITWTRDNPEAYERALRAADRAARDTDRTLVLLFDDLEHLHSDRAAADRLVGGLLEVALELRLTTSALRAKIFVRPDMYKSAPKHFADASKLEANSANLIWYRENLYGLLFHQLGNHGSPEAEAFRKSTGGWQPGGAGRFVAPTALLADEDRQEEVFVQLAGPYMGTDRRKGLTYTWVPNHLQDGNREVSPRTWLTTLRDSAALTAARFAMHEHPIHYDAIRDSLQSAANIRVKELGEDIVWAEKAIKQLEGGQVPMEPSTVRAFWEQGGLSAVLQSMAQGEEGVSGPRSTEPFALLEELKDIGVLTRRTTRGKQETDWPVDIPDVYRLAFDIGRKGGVARKPVR